MAEAYKGLTIEFNGDTTGLSKALREVRKGARDAESDLKLASKALKADPNSARAFASQQAALRSQIGSTRDELETLGKGLAELGEEDSLTPEQQRQWNRLQSEIVITEQRLKGYQQELVDSVTKQNVLASAVGRTGQRLQDFSKRFDGVAKGMRSAGAALTLGVTAPLVAAGAMSVKAATEIDTSLTNVKKTVDGTAEDYQRLKDAAIEFSKTNAVSASEILDIQSLGAQLGYSIDELQEFGEVVSGLDIATNMSAETAASELAQFFNIMGEGHDQTRNYGSTIVALGNSFATTESDISSMAMRIAGAGKQIGLSSADVLGLSTALSSMGINAEAGGTAISTIMAGIDASVAKSDEGLSDWAATAGMSADEFARAWREDAAGALSAVLVGMDEAVQSGGNMTVMLEELGITSIRQTDTFKRLASNSSFLGEAVEMANAAWADNTALGAEVANRNDSLAAKFEMLKNRVVAVAEEVGAPLADAMLSAIDAAEPLFQAIESGAKAFSDMSVEEQRAVLACAALAGALGPMLTVGSRAIGMAGKLGEMLSKHAGKAAAADAASRLLADGTLKAGDAAVKAGGAMKGFGGAIGLVVAIVAGSLIALFAKWKKRSDDVRDATDTLRRSTEGLRDAAKRSADGFDDASGAADGYGRSLEGALARADRAIADQAAAARDAADAWNELGTSEAAIDGAMESIKRLTGRVDENGDAVKLNRDEQSELIAAIATLNDTCGTTYSVTNAVTGELSAQTSEIEANTEAWKANAEMQAAQEQIGEASKRIVENKAALREVNDQIDALKESMGGISTVPDTLGAIDFDTIELEALQHRADDLAGSIYADEKHIENLTGIQGEAAATARELAEAEADAAGATDDTAASADGLAESATDAAEALGSEATASEEAMEKLYELLDAHPKLGAAMAECGWSAEELQARLEAAGVDGEALASAVESVGDKTANAFSKIEGASEASLAQMLENLRHNTECTRNWSSNLESLYNSTEDATIQAFVRHMGELGPEYAAQVQAMVDQGGDVLSELAYAWADAEEAGREGGLAAMGVTSDAVDAEWERRVADAEEYARQQADAERAAIVDATPETVAAAADLMGRTLDEFVGFAKLYGVEGDEAVSAFAAAVAEGMEPAKAAAEAMGRAAEEGASEADMESQGDAAVDGYARPLYNSSGIVRPAGAAMGGYAAAGAGSVDFHAAGIHAAQAYAGGLGGKVASMAVTNAATILAKTQEDILGHSVPRKGPLRNHGKGEREWGLHAAQNFAGGMQSGASSVARASRALADAAAMGLAAVPSDAALMASVSADVAHRVSVDASGMASAVRSGLAAALASASPSITVAGDVTLDAGGLDARTADRLAESIYRNMVTGRLGG